MSERNKRFEAARRARMFSALGSSLLALSLGVQAYTNTGIFSGFSQKQEPKVEFKSSAPSKVQITEDAVKNINAVRRLTRGDLSKYDSSALFDKASAVQLAIMNASVDLHESDREIFDEIVPEDARVAFTDKNIHFTFVSPDQAKEDCFNPIARLNGAGSEVVYATVPLSDTVTNSPSSTLHSNSV